MSDPDVEREIAPIYKETLLNVLNFSTQETAGKDKWSPMDNLFYSEKHLRQYHETFVEAETFMHQGYWEIELPGNKIFWSDGMYRLFGYKTIKDRESIHLSYETINLHLSPEEINRRDVEWNSILKDKHCYLREIEVTTFDERKKRLETFGKVHRNEFGVPIKVTGITREITKLREYESALHAKVNELSRSNKALEDFAFMH